MGSPHSHPMSTPTHLTRATTRTVLVANEHLACSAEGCSLPRVGFSHMCRRCTPTYRLHGHPKGTAMRPREYKEHVTHLMEVMNDNENHPGLAHALKLIDGLIQQAKASDGLQRESQPFPSAQEFNRLAKAGTTARDILATLVAALYVHKLDPYRSPSDEARDFTASHAVFQLAPRAIRGVARGGKPSWVLPHFQALKHCGTFLRTTLAPLIVQLHIALDNRDQKAVRVVEAMRLPFA
jgi:hypothetical protein